MVYAVTDTALGRVVEDRLLLHALSAEVIDRWIHHPHHTTPRLIGVGDEPLALGMYKAGPPLYPAVWREPPRGLLDWPSAARPDDGHRYWLLTTWSMADHFDGRLCVVHVATTLPALLSEFPDAATFIHLDHEVLTDEDRSLLVLRATQF